MLKIPGKGAIFALIVVAALIGVYYFGFANDTGTEMLTVTSSTNTKYINAFPVGSTWYINLDEPIDIVRANQVIGTWGLTDMGIKYNAEGSGGTMYYTSTNWGDALSNDFDISAVGLDTGWHTIVVDYMTPNRGICLFVVYQSEP